MRMIKLSKHNSKIIAQVLFANIMVILAFVSFIILGSCACNIIASVLLAGKSSISSGIALWLAYSSMAFPISAVLAYCGLSK